MNIEKVASILKGISKKNIPKTDWSQFGKGSISGSGWNPISRLQSLTGVAFGGEFQDMKHKIIQRHNLMRGKPMNSPIADHEGVMSLFNNQVRRKNPEYTPEKGKRFFFPKREYEIKERFDEPTHRRIQEATAAKYLGGSKEEAREALARMRSRQTKAQLVLGAGAVGVVGAGYGYKKHLDRKEQDLYNSYYNNPYINYTQ